MVKKAVAKSMEEEQRANEEKLKQKDALHAMEVDHLRSMLQRQPNFKPYVYGAPAQTPPTLVVHRPAPRSRHGSPARSVHTVRTHDSGYNYTYYEPQHKYD